MTDTELLEFQNRRRVQVCPEFESCWHAMVYGEGDQPEAIYSGSTAREALANAAAADGGANSAQCPACKGYGRVNDGSGARSPYGPKCPTCGGSGRVAAGVGGNDGR